MTACNRATRRRRRAGLPQLLHRVEERRHQEDDVLRPDEGGASHQRADQRVAARGSLRPRAPPDVERRRGRQHRARMRIRRRHQRVVDRARSEPDRQRGPKRHGGVEQRPCQQERQPGAERGCEDAAEAGGRLEHARVAVGRRREPEEVESPRARCHAQVDRRPHDRGADGHQVSRVAGRQRRVHPLGVGRRRRVRVKSVQAEVLVLKVQIAIEDERSQVDEVVDGIAHDDAPPGLRQEHE